MNNSASGGLVIMLIVATLLFIYVAYWVGKPVNYKDMVRATITEMVKPEALK